MTATTGHSASPDRAGRDWSFSRPILTLLRAHRRMQEWHYRARSRRELARLDPHMLRDIGITPADRHAEMRKPFWRP